MEKRVIDVLKSKRFWVFVIAIVVMLIVSIEPRLASAESQLNNNFLYLAMLAIGGYSAQDMILAWLSRPGNVDLSVNIAQEGIDATEKYFQVDIPDGLEVEGKAELQRRLQALVDGYKAKVQSETSQR